MGAFCPPGSRVGILPGGEEEKGLTNVDIWTKIHTITMAEVAVCISIAPVWQLPEQERVHRRRIHRCHTGISGPSENIRRTVIKKLDGVLTWGDECLLPCVAMTWGILLYKEGSL